MKHILSWAPFFSFFFFNIRLECNACPYSFKQTQIKIETSQTDVSGLTISCTKIHLEVCICLLLTVCGLYCSLKWSFKTQIHLWCLLSFQDSPLLINQIPQLDRKPPSNRALVGSSVEFWWGTMGCLHWADPWCAHIRAYHMGVASHHGPPLLTVCRFLGVPPLGQGVLFFFLAQLGLGPRDCEDVNSPALWGLASLASSEMAWAGTLTLSLRSQANNVGLTWGSVSGAMCWGPTWAY